jgi:hypothetical protein
VPTDHPVAHHREPVGERCPEAAEWVGQKPKQDEERRAGAEWRGPKPTWGAPAARQRSTWDGRGRPGAGWHWRAATLQDADRLQAATRARLRGGAATRAMDALRPSWDAAVRRAKDGC